MDVGAEKVESLDELLMEMLLRLPPKSVYRFRCVSKRWKNIIYDPFFIQGYSERWRPGRGSGSGGGGHGSRLLGFIQGTSKYMKPRQNPRPISQPAINMLPAAGILNNMAINCIPNKLGSFINSSDGLILCGRHPMTYNVLNPITRQWVTLSVPPNNYCDNISIGLICDEAEIRVNDAGQQEKIANYRVLRAGTPMDTDNILLIQTYTSKTRVWIESVLVATDPFVLFNFEPPLVFNGVFHWHAISHVIAVYDPNYDNHLQLIELLNDGCYSCYIVTRSNHDDGDVLWFGYRNTRDCMEFWMLPKGKSGSYYRSTTIPRTEWMLMHAMRDYSLYNDCGLMMNTEGELFSLETFIPWNPIVVVLRLGKTVFLYNLKNRSVESVSYLGCCLVAEDDDLRLTPYLDSSFLPSLLF